jgi:hypothetical protein
MTARDTSDMVRADTPMACPCHLDSHLEQMLHVFVIGSVYYRHWHQGQERMRLLLGDLLASSISTLSRIIHHYQASIVPFA